MDTDLAATACRRRALTPALRADQRGAASVEYLVLTALGLFIAIGLGALGVAMVHAYGNSLQILYSEFP